MHLTLSNLPLRRRTMHLTPDQVAAYERDGFVAVPQLLSQEEVEALRRRTEEIILGEISMPSEFEKYIQIEPALAGRELEGRERLGAVRKLWQLWKFDPVFEALIRHPAILDVVESLLGPDIKFFGDQMLLKPPFHGSAKPYHQDSPYWPIDPPALVTCWIALDDATVENGCMRFLPGSHRRGIIPHRHLEGPHLVPEEYGAMDTAGEVCVELKAGGASFHHSCTLHETSPNTTPYPRRAHTLAYMSAHSRYTGKPPQPDFPLVRGREIAGCV
jgi:phytanoyl-CoA hydroxylase